MRAKSWSGAGLLLVVVGVLTACSGSNSTGLTNPSGTPSSICAKLEGLPCAPANCVAALEAGQAGCSQQAGAYQALLDCLQGATFVCQQDVPNTSSCVVEGTEVESCAQVSGLTAPNDTSNAGSPASVCAKLEALPCAPANCVGALESQQAACSGEAAAYQSLLDCLQGATFVCEGGMPNTTSCIAEASPVTACAQSAVP
jgi:hypothetical protein